MSTIRDIGGPILGPLVGRLLVRKRGDPGYGSQSEQGGLREIGWRYLSNVDRCDWNPGRGEDLQGLHVPSELEEDRGVGLGHGQLWQGQEGKRREGQPKVICLESDSTIGGGGV